MKRIALMWIVLTGALLVPDDGLRPDFLLARRVAARSRSLHRCPDQGRYVRHAAGDGSGLHGEHGARRYQQGPDQDADEDRSPSQPARYGHVSDVHRSDRHEQGEAVCPRHAPARQPRQDRRDRNPVDHDGLLAIQRRRVPEVFVQREVGRHSRQQARYARHAGRRRQRLPRCVSRREEGPGAVGLSLQPHGRRRAHRQRVPRRTAAMSASRAV